MSEAKLKLMKEGKILFFWFIGSVVASLSFGPFAILVIFPVFAYFVIRFFYDLYNFVKKNHKEYERFVLCFVHFFFFVALTISFVKDQLKIGHKNFLIAVEKIKDYKKAHGDYPLRYSDLKISANPYISLFGPDLKYRYYPQSTQIKYPIFWLTEAAIFSRWFYNFEKDKETYLD